MDRSALTRDVERYYSEKLRAHGATPHGVDWNSAESQLVRYAQIARILDDAPHASMTDVGCGYGGFLPFLRQRGFSGPFVGVDLSADMIATAVKHCEHDPKASFVVGDAPPSETDFVTASGIFSVRLSHADETWLDYILSTLDGFNRFARRGFAFNCLTSYSDANKMRPDLYYADPRYIFDRCKRLYANNVALLHDYGLYEFTILVRK